jgi:hypothetical protein
MNPDPDLSTSAWRFEAWIHQYPLNLQTILDYFKHSNFYIRTCNNEILAMSNGDINRLKYMEGLEYEVETTTKDNYFIIKQQYRISPTEVNLQQLFYIVGIDPIDAMQPLRGTVFPMPDMQAVLKENLVNKNNKKNKEKQKQKQKNSNCSQIVVHIIHIL